MLSYLYKIVNQSWWFFFVPCIKRTLEDKYTPRFSNFDSKKYLEQIPVYYHKTSKKACLIEPQTGWAIRGRTIIAESYAYWTNVSSGWPPLPPLLKYLNPFKKIRRVDRAVSFHYGWNNYYHFFADTLPQIKYWQSLNQQGITWIVPAKIKDIKFVQDYLSLDPLFDKQDVIFQSSNEYVQVTSEAHFIKRSRFGSIELKTCIDLMHSKLFMKYRESDKKIFLIRRGYRSATNLKELISIAETYGFDCIQTDNMSLPEQIKLFSNTRWLIGFHGAGLTNMIFRKDKEMSVLEIFPKNKVPLHYWHLTIDFGFNYSFLVGDGYTSEQEQFEVDPNQFNQSILRMLNEDPSLHL